MSEPHLCCGSAGTYSLLQAELSEQLKRRKLHALEEGEPGLIATANIGCLLQLRSGARVPVVHWFQLLDGEGTDAGFGDRQRQHKINCPAASGGEFNPERIKAYYRPGYVLRPLSLQRHSLAYRNR